MSSSQTAIANRLDFNNSYTNEFDNDQTGADLITPNSGKLLAIKGVSVVTEASSGTLRLHIGGDTVIKVYASAAPATGYIPLFIEGARDEALQITSDFGADQNYFILVNYKET